MVDKAIYKKKIARGGLTLTEAWTLQEATTEEVETARHEYKSGKQCVGHIYVTFEAGWPYDECNCEICGHRSLV